MAVLWLLLLLCFSVQALQLEACCCSDLSKLQTCSSRLQSCNEICNWNATSHLICHRFSLFHASYTTRLLSSLQIQQVIVEDVCTITQLADSRQRLDRQLAKYVADIRVSQAELAQHKVSSLTVHRSSYPCCLKCLTARPYPTLPPKKQQQHCCPDCYEHRASKSHQYGSHLVSVVM